MQKSSMKLWNQRCWPRSGCGGLIMAKFLITIIQANLCRRFTNSPELLLLKILPISDHHSHFWAATFDFTTFFMLLFLHELSWTVKCVTWIWLNCRPDDFALAELYTGDLALAELCTGWHCSGWTAYWVTLLWLNCILGDFVCRLAELYSGWLGSGWTVYRVTLLWVIWLWLNCMYTGWLGSGWIVYCFGWTVYWVTLLWLNCKVGDLTLAEL